MYTSIYTPREKNIILTGMPWAWKTSIWKPFAKEIGYNSLDFDDDVLEKTTLETSEKVIWFLNISSHWIIPEDISNKEVKDLVKLFWDEDFLRFEWYMWENLNFNEPTVLSTSWSLPLELWAMAHLKVDWEVVYIDTPIEVILNRLELMKTDRIIWMWKMTLEEILNYRKKFYDVTKDYNFKVPLFEEDAINSKNERNRQKNIILKEFINFYKENKIWIN